MIPRLSSKPACWAVAPSFEDTAPQHESTICAWYAGKAKSYWFVETRWFNGGHRWEPSRKYVTSVSGDVLFPVEEQKTLYLATPFELFSENNSPRERERERNFGFRFFPGNPQSPHSFPMTHHGRGKLTSVTVWYFILTSEVSLGIYPVCIYTGNWLFCFALRILS